MKRKFILLLLVLIIGGVVSACSGKKALDNDTTTNKEVENAQPTEEGTITIGLSSDPSIFNPLYAAETCFNNSTSNFSTIILCK